MTNFELNKMLGEAIEEVRTLKENNDHAVFVLKKAEAVSSLAKRQVASNHQIIQVDRMSGRTDRANKVVGD